MQGVKRAAAHMSAVVRGMLFTGFTVQILLGLTWMCRNFGQVQDFGEAESVLYGGILRLSGGIPQIIYLLQAVSAFWAGYYFLEKLQPLGRGFFGRCRAVWRALALLSCPFAMQCHLALLPFSFMNSLFLLMLLFVLQAAERKESVSCAIDKERQKRIFRGLLKGRVSADRCGHRRIPVLLTLAVFCVGLAVVLSGAADTASREKPGGSIEAALASRFAWPTIWADHSRWSEDLQEITRDVVWEASFAPGNMERLNAAIEEKVSPETAKAYYLQIAEIGWNTHASMVVRQIGWDVLGYTVTPVIVQLQLRGGAYDSYTCRNYEIMGGKTPALTRDYIDYYSWWFVVSIALTFVSVILELSGGAKIRWRNRAVFALICLLFSGILAGVLALRGAGVMDYKYTAAVNQLWLIPALMLTGRNPQGSSDKAGFDGKECRTIL